MRGDKTDGENGPIDVSDMTLHELREWGESNLLAELRRVLGADADDSDVVARWTNSV